MTVWQMAVQVIVYLAFFMAGWFVGFYFCWRHMSARTVIATKELLAAFQDAVDILEGDGEYPETARRMRCALKEATAQSPAPIGKGADGID